MDNLPALDVVVRLSIRNPESGSNSAFGPGVATLCEGVRDLGSLNAAAKSIGMAYSKAWRIMKDTEEALGTQLLIRGGANGSTLTERGEQILNTYRFIERRVHQEAQELFDEEFFA